MWLWFVRHGQTDDNVQGIIQGQKDTPLNDHGRHESRRLAKRLKSVHFTEAYSSPLSRAKELMKNDKTAEIVLQHHPDIPLQTAEQLKERSLGSMEGRRRLRGEHAPADAETYESMFARQTEWFDALLTTHEPPDPLPTRSSIFTKLSPLKASRQTQIHHHSTTPDPDHDIRDPDEPTILICSHGAWLGNFFSLLLSKRYKFFLARDVDSRAHCLNTSVMLVRADWKNGRWKGEVVSWGDAEHLGDMMDDEVVGVADDVQ